MASALVESRNCHMAIRTSAVSLVSVPLDDIVPDPSQPRQSFDLQSLDRLAVSIKERGLKNPIRIRWENDLGKYMILSGERRYRAAKQAGLSTIDCILVEGELTEADRFEEQLTENLLRQDLNPIEKANGMRALMKAQNWTQKRLAEHLQIEASDVTRSLALLDLPDKIQKFVADGTLAPRTAYEITKLEYLEDQLEVANIVVDQGLNIKDIEHIIRLKMGHGPTRKKTTSCQRKPRRDERAVVEKAGQAEITAAGFSFLLRQYNHPGGHIASILKGDREDIALMDQIRTLQAHILLLKSACNGKEGV